MKLFACIKGQQDLRLEAHSLKLTATHSHTKPTLSGPKPKQLRTQTMGMEIGAFNIFWWPAIKGVPPRTQHLFDLQLGKLIQMYPTEYEKKSDGGK